MNLLSFHRDLASATPLAFAQARKGGTKMSKLKTRSDIFDWKQNPAAHGYLVKF